MATIRERLLAKKAQPKEIEIVDVKPAIHVQVKQ
jgi:hypothetical protein